jgi:flagellar hook-basal body complex protein FliE
MTNTIQGLPIPDPSPAPARTADAAGDQSDFLATLRDTINQVQDLHTDAQGKVASMLEGSGEDVHSAMIAVEKAGLAFEMMVQVRNKIVQAYQTVSQMTF